MVKLVYCICRKPGLAAHQPSASKHDIEHSNWYNPVAKVVV
jgi:hypothetical protein